jgi:hypothetical protein
MAVAAVDLAVGTSFGTRAFPTFPKTETRDMTRNQRDSSRQIGKSQ